MCAPLSVELISNIAARHYNCVVRQLRNKWLHNYVQRDENESPVVAVHNICKKATVATVMWLVVKLLQSTSFYHVPALVLCVCVVCMRVLTCYIHTVESRKNKNILKRTWIPCTIISISQWCLIIY